MDKVRYIGPSPEEDRFVRPAPAQVEAGRQASFERRRKKEQRMERAAKIAVGLGCTGSVLLAVLVLATVVGGLIKLFAWVWGL